MNRQEIFDKIQPIIADALDRSLAEVTPDKTLEDLKADSLDSVETVMKIEKEFNIAILDSEMEKFTDIQSIVDYLFKIPSINAGN